MTHKPRASLFDLPLPASAQSGAQRSDKKDGNLILWLVILLIITSMACSVFGFGASKAVPTIDNWAIQTNAAETMAAITVPSSVIPSATELAIVIDNPSPTAPPEPAASNTPLPPPSYPSVLHVAYIKDGNVYLWREGETSLGLSSTHDAADVRITDDGQWIAYIRQDPTGISQELWAVNTNGPLDAQALVSSAEMAVLKASSPYPDSLGLWVVQFEWRPGTHELAYSTAPLFEGPGFLPFKDLRLVNADTLEKTTRFDFNQGGMFYYSPDGSQIALVNPESISLVNADGSNLRDSVITYPLVGTNSEYQYHPHPIWAADSQSLRVAIPPAETLAEPLPPTSLWSIPADGSPAVFLSSIIAIPFAWPDNAFAPDLQQVMYLKPTGEPADNIRELHIALPDGNADFIFITSAYINTMTWSPDSYRFLYAISSADNRGVFLGDVVSGESAIITSEPSLIQEIRWIEPSRILYFWENTGSWELRISDLGGTRHAHIDTIPDYYTAYDFTP